MVIRERFQCLTKGVLPLFVLLSVCCNSHRSIAAETETPLKPNILLIAVDTLRADHLHCYGYSRQTSPVIDGLAGEGVMFLNAVSLIPATTPSFASIFTAKSPMAHGILDNHWKGYFLEEKHVTLAEVLKSYGYETAAFISGFTLCRDANLSQGFDIYHDDFSSYDTASEDTADRTNEHVFRWLNDRKEKDVPFFLFIHYFDPHGKYQPPPPYDGMFRYPEDFKARHKIPRYQKYKNVSNPFFYIAHYDGEIRFVDEQIGKLLEKMSAMHLMDDTFVIFLSDHGEAMNERSRWFDHGYFVYEEQIRVPLILWYPKRLKPGMWEPGVRLIDVMPTVLDALGIAPPEGTEGVSLLKLIDKKQEPVPYIYSESARGDPGINSGSFHGVWGKQLSVRTSQWKMIMTPKSTGMFYELYDLDHDPKESENLIGRDLPVEAELREKIMAYRLLYKNSPYAAKKELPKPEKEISKAEEEGLRSLGYL